MSEWSDFTGDPQTPEEWQIAVDLADYYVHVDAAKTYGLIKTETQICIERCHELLERGRAQGVTPSHDGPEKLALKAFHAGMLERRRTA